MDQRTRLPTLIIGWELAKNVTELKFSILDKELSKTLHWEFTPEEDVIQYTKGLNKFVKNIPYAFCDLYEYINYDPVFHPNFSDKIDLPKGGDLYVYKNDYAYYFHPDNTKHLKGSIYGFKLDYLRHYFQNIDFITQLKEVANRSYLDEKGDLYNQYLKKFKDFVYLRRCMVIFAF